MARVRRGKPRDRRSTRHIKVYDAAQVISMAEQCLVNGQRSRAGTAAHHAASVASCILTDWRESPVVLRADPDFATALLDSETDVELIPDWLERLPFDSMAVSLPIPVSLHDGHVLCHYVGFIATGIRRDKPEPETPGATNRCRSVMTRYGPLPEADGIRFLCLYTEDQDPTSRCQTLSVVLRGELAKDPLTLTQLIEAQRRTAEEAGQPWGDELPTLVPLSIQLSLYLAAQEPDLDWIPAEQMARPQQLTTARVANVGWRVGAALRTWHRQAPTVDAAEPTGRPRRRLPPHIRRAHWHRVRVAVRDGSGQIVGDRLGDHGTDWEYQLRWYPPTPVAAGADPPPPVVRDVAASREAPPGHGESQ